MNEQLAKIVSYLKDYDGPEIRLMEVCGTHTAAIFKGAIHSLISPKIHLISGPGCPVCVTPAAFIDKCVEYAHMDGHVLYSFGDMLKVPGTAGSLSDHKGQGAHVEVVYSPFEVLEKAAAQPDVTHVVAAVGFETTAPIYGLMIREMQEKDIHNVRLVTAIKTILPALTWICDSQPEIDGFICPGHVCVIIGSDPFLPLAEKYKKPFVVAGFEPEHLLVTIYDLVRQIEAGEHNVGNHYKNAVHAAGNPKALDVLEEYYTPGAAVWRGLGSIPDSGLYISEKYQEYDGGSFGLDQDIELPPACRCADVITGRINPADCPMFASGSCTPTSPYGPCMVSAEGACGIWYRNR